MRKEHPLLRSFLCASGLPYKLQRHSQIISIFKYLLIIHLLIQRRICSYMQRCRRIQSSLSLSGTNPRWSIHTNCHLHHRFVRRGPVELPLDARSALISTSLATTVRGHVCRFDLNHRSRGSRTIALPNMADKSNARSEEQHAPADALKLVNRLNESRSPYVGPCNSALLLAFSYRNVLTRVGPWPYEQPSCLATMGLEIY